MIGILMLIFGDPKSQFAGLTLIFLCLVGFAVLGAIGLVAVLGSGVDSWFPRGAGRVQALGADVFMLFVLSLVLANLGLLSWVSILSAYLILQLPLVVTGRTLGQILEGVSVQRMQAARGLAGTLLEEAAFQLSFVQAIVVTAVWLVRRLLGPDRRSRHVEGWSEALSTRARVSDRQRGVAYGLGITLALVLIGLGSCSMSLVPASITDAATFDRAQACTEGATASPQTCLVELPATVLRIDHDVTRDQSGNVLDSLIYIQVSLNGHPRSLQADTTQGTRVIDSLSPGQSVTAGLWGGDLVLIRTEAGDIWEDGRRPGESSGGALLWLGLGVFLAGLVLAVVMRFGRRSR